jgi:[histone H3]-lysine9 N-trimethyltransferase SUV39H
MEDHLEDQDDNNNWTLPKENQIKLIHKTFSRKSYKTNSNAKGCECNQCGSGSSCCPDLMGKKFSYTKRGSIKKGSIIRNFWTIIECGKDCSCPADCLNRRSQQDSIEVHIIKTDDRGWSIQTDQNVAKGQYIGTYTGELLDKEDADERDTSYQFLGRFGDTDYVVDAIKYGNWTRYINHSCVPNIQTVFVGTCSDDPLEWKIW